MKALPILLIDIYQLLFSPLLHSLFGVNRFCRFVPSCSEYARQMITKRGLITGLYLSLLRLIACQPFFNPRANQ